MVGIVESRTLGQRFSVADNESIIDAYCPIDRTQLVSVSGSDFHAYSCFGCGASYNYGDTNPESLNRQARAYMNERVRLMDEKKAQLDKLEKIIMAGKKNGF